jgi:hypothetical protein
VIYNSVRFPKVPWLYVFSAAFLCNLSVERLAKLRAGKAVMPVSEIVIDLIVVMVLVPKVLKLGSFVRLKEVRRPIVFPVKLVRF